MLPRQKSTVSFHVSRALCLNLRAGVAMPTIWRIAALRKRVSFGQSSVSGHVDLVLLYMFRTIVTPVFWAISSRPAPGVHSEDFILNSYRKRSMTMKIGMLTGGGDCPGLNAVIRAVVRKGVFHYHDEFVGFLEGWRGLIEDKSMPLDLDAVGGILPRGGTILRTSRTNPSKRPDGIDRCIATIEKHKIDALVAIGGDDTLSVAQKLHEKGIKVVGVPKTIDNDLGGTDYTFGFDTACNVVCEAIDRVHTTAEAHNRVMVVEVMGRDAGWIALYSGIAGGADVILIPERPFDVDKVAESIRQRHERGRYFSIVVVAEGAKFATGAGAPDRAGHGQRRIRTRQAGRDRQYPGARDREAHRLRNTRGGARTHSARRLSERLRPCSGDALWPGRDRHGASRRVWLHGGPARRTKSFPLR